MGSITEQKPYTYAIVDHKSQIINKTEVASNFLLKDNVLSFDIASYSGTLVIDPQLDWATYFGGTENENWTEGFDAFFGFYSNLINFQSPQVGTDGNGNVYLAGNTLSKNLATVGAHQDTFSVYIPGNLTNPYLAKFLPSGALAWATYYGGRSTYLRALACSNNGDIYIGGSTASWTSIATKGSFKDSCTTYWIDGFLVKFNDSGQRIWGTHYGGDSADYLTAIYIDQDDNVFIAGATNSINSITTPGAYQDTVSLRKPDWFSDLFLARFNATGQRLWGTYYRVYPINTAISLTSDHAGNIYIAGNTADTLTISSSNAHQRGMGGGYTDGFLAKFTTDGNYVWNTYYGGDNVDAICGLACDSDNNVYISGYSASTGNIATPGSYQPQRGPTIQAFAAKFNAAGVRQWGTYYGGENDDNFTAAVIDKKGRLCLAGTTYSNNDIATAGAWKKYMQGYGNGMFVQFSTNGERLWASYFGNGLTAISNMVTDTLGNYYICGATSADTGIATANAHQTKFGGGRFRHGQNGWDHFLLKASPDSAIFIDCDSGICFDAGAAADTIIVAYASTKGFYPAMYLPHSFLMQAAALPIRWI